MLYSVPSTKTLRQIINDYAELYDVWKSFAEVSKDCDLQVDVFDFHDDNTFQVSIWAYKANRSLGFIESKYYSKNIYGISSALAIPKDWTFEH